MQSHRCGATLPSLIGALLVAVLSVSAAAAPNPSAEALLRAGRFEAALAKANLDSRQRPDDVGAQELVLDILLTMGDHALAQAQARARVEEKPGEPDSHYLLGRASGDPLASRRAFEAALKLKPDHARAHMGMGSLHEASARSATTASERLLRAADAYGRAVRYDASLGEAWFGRVRVLRRLGRGSEAAQVARAGIASVPDEAGLPLLLAELEPSGAIPVLEAALKRVGPDAALHSALAWSHLRAGKASAGLAQANAALALLPSHADARLARAYAAEVQNKKLPAAVLPGLLEARRLERQAPTEALARYPALVRRAPRSAMVLLGRASARRANGDRAGELEDLVGAAGRDPANEEVAGVAGLALLAAGQAQAAIPFLQKALGARPADAVLGLGLAQALAGAAMATDARLLLERLAAAHPGNADVQLRYIQALLDAGQNAQAYGVAKVSMQLVSDPRLVVAFVKVAPLAGRAAEAAEVLAPLAERSEGSQLDELVRRLRELGAQP